MFAKRHIFAFLAIFAGASAVAASGAAGMPSSGTRYATDAYPGFDNEDNILATEKKQPRWFSWINGPKMTNAVEQLAWADECAAEGSLRAARRGYDALVREWPSSPEAPVAQRKLADLYWERYLEYENAFEEYKYLVDYYSAQCDYDVMAARLYEAAKMMRIEGKTLVFFRFANTVDVRRAFEAVVRRAPGAKFAPEAMLTIAELREDSGEFEKAVEVYENLRNIYYGTPEAKAAIPREARVRMRLLREHGYNRQRCQDTIGFLKLSLQTSGVGASERKELEGFLAEAVSWVEDEAYKSAKFYDSRTRTLRSAIKAYERFLSEYPASSHADEARARLDELRSQGGEK